MTIAANAAIQYESAQTLTSFTAMTDATDHLVFTAPGTPGNIWSGKSGYEPDIRPDGVVSGIDILSAGSGNDEVDVTTFTAWIGGELKEVSSTTVSITRASTLTHVINSVILTGTTVSAVKGVEGTSFVTARGAAGGPPYVPVESIEIGQVKTDSQAFVSPAEEQAIFYPAVSADDGHWNAAEFQNSTHGVIIGNVNAKDYNFYIRFPNVTIPNQATITSAVIKVTPDFGWAVDTCSANIYFNDEDDAAAPESIVEANALNLTAAIPWTSISSWGNDVQEDTPGLTSILQVIVDRAGWVSGQAVMAVVENNSSDINAVREFTSIDYDSGSEKAELHVTWTLSPIGTTAEILQTPGMHQERADYPLYRRPQNLGHGVLATTVSRKNAHIEFYTALDPCHTGDLCKGVYIQYYTPTFTTIESNGFSPADPNSTQSFAQRYEKILGYKTDSLRSASFHAELEDNITDALTALDGQMLIFKFFPNADLAPFMLTMGILRFSSAFPQAGPITTACTVVAKLPTARFAS